MNALELLTIWTKCLNHFCHQFFNFNLFLFVTNENIYIYHENKIIVIREGEWRIHRKMSQWLWNPSSLKFGMNLLAATPSSDNEMQHPAMTDYSQLWLLLAATVSCNIGCDSELQHPAMTVLQVKIYEFEICVFHIMICI